MELNSRSILTLPVTQVSLAILITKLVADRLKILKYSRSCECTG